MHTSGSFTVKMQPQTDAETADTKLERRILDKVFEGELAGTSRGQMLFALGEVKGSGGYVAIEMFTGKLNGRFGTFVLQHSGTMQQGRQQLSIGVVPDSGTGELRGIKGWMEITNIAGDHRYDFEYTIEP